MNAKRLMDVILSSIALILAAPVMVAIAAVIRVTLGSPVLFRQLRPGLYAQPFEMLKFRTMTETCGVNGILLDDARRLTRIGRALRASSLDELPELINVLKGEMSLVGPRPLLMRYTPYFTTEERVRFSVLPGITGLAQVNGRNDLSWDERFALDAQYVRHQSARLDVSILLKTFWCVIRRDGLRVDPGASLSDFDQERIARQWAEEGTGTGTERSLSS